MAGDPVITDSPLSGSEGQSAGSDSLSWFTRAKFGVVRGFLWGIASCLGLGGLYQFGRFFGTCEWLINHKRRRRFRKRLGATLGEHVQEMSCSMTYACWQHFVRTRCDKLLYLIFDKISREEIIRRTTFHDRELIDNALKQGRGVYVCVSHNGSHHVLIQIMAMLGYHVAGVRDRNEGAMRRYIQEKYEESFPELRAVRMFFADSYPRDLYRCFQDGYILGTALDVSRVRAAHLRTAKVKVFGEEREFLTGTMQIALRCKVPVLQGFVVSRDNFYFDLIPLDGLVDPDKEEDTPEVLQQAMQRYADNIGRHLLKYPDHYSRV